MKTDQQTLVILPVSPTTLTAIQGASYAIAPMPDTLPLTRNKLTTARSRIPSTVSHALRVHSPRSRRADRYDASGTVTDTLDYAAPDLMIMKTGP